MGRGLAERCVAEGMRVVLVGTDRGALVRFQDEVETQGGEALAVTADVSHYEEVKALAKKTLDRFGGVHLLINNAGLATMDDSLKPAWELPLEDWEQTLAVNLWGVIYGIHVFVPFMLQQDEECHVVNIAFAPFLFSRVLFNQGSQLPENHSNQSSSDAFIRLVCFHSSLLNQVSEIPT